MARPASKHPTELEFQILKILWNLGPLAVRDVRCALRDVEGRDLAHTSVITVLNTMVSKKYLRRRPRANAYIFEAAMAREEISSGIVSDLVDRVFDGSAVSLMVNLLKNEEVSPGEHAELRKLIDRYRKSKE